MLSGLFSRAIFVGGAALVGTWQYRNYQMKSNHLTEVSNHIPTTSIIQADTIKKQFNYVDSFVAPVNGKWIESVDQYAKEFFGHTPRVVQLLLDSKRTIQSLAKNERVDCNLGEGKAAFLVRSRSEKEIVLGYDDKLFDVRISFLMDEKQQPQLMTDTRQSADNKAVTISTVVHVKGLLGKVMMWPLAWCQKMILPSWIIQTYTAHQEIKAAQASA